MSEYFANDPECHDLLPCALRSHRVAGLGGWPHVGGVTSTSTRPCGPVRSCGPVPFAVTDSKKADAGCGYKTLADLVASFWEVGGLPEGLNVDLWDEGDGIANTLSQRRAVFHRHCKSVLQCTRQLSIVCVSVAVSIMNLSVLMKVPQVRHND